MQPTNQIVDYIKSFFKNEDVSIELIRSPDFRKIITLRCRKKPNGPNDKYTYGSCDVEITDYALNSKDNIDSTISRCIVYIHLLLSDYQDFQIEHLKNEFDNNLVNKRAHFSKILEEFNDYETLVFGSQRSLLETYKERQKKEGLPEYR